MSPETPDPAPPVVAPVRSRRALLTAALGGLGGLLASRLGSPDTAAAAAGGPLVMGAANSAGTTNTSLATASTGTALLVTQTGSGTALRGSAVGPGSIAGFFTAANGPGISGVTASPNNYGVVGQSDGAAGTGAGVRAKGINNDGISATTDNGARFAVKATSSAVGGTVARFENTGGGAGTSAGPAIRAYTAGGSDADVHPSGAYEDAAGEFAGPNGVIGVSKSAAGTYGVLGRASGAGGGVSGVSTSNTGVLGQSDSGEGVYGSSYSNNGVRGSTASGIGVVGSSASNHGVSGSSSGAIGVIGTSSSNSGVLGQSVDGVGVYGYSATSSAGYFEGPLYANSLDAGSVSAGVKSFRIDHPTDPAGKVLVHSCVESDERLTVYAGTVTTDAGGQATVELPAWFESLNRDLRYQLTVIGSFAQAMVKRKVNGNRFTIATSEPGTEVCWQVTGVRQDAYSRAHPLVVESTKTGKERGRYLHPAEHGQPDAKGVHYELQAARRTAQPRG